MQIYLHFVAEWAKKAHKKAQPVWIVLGNWSVVSVT